MRKENRKSRICPTCNSVHPSDAAVAVGRFLAGGHAGYMASNVAIATERATREEAEADYCAANRRSQ